MASVRSLPPTARRSVGAVGITGVRGAVVGISGDGRQVTPGYPDFDDAAVAPAQKLVGRYGNSFLDRTGCPAFPLAGLPKMMLHAGDPDIRLWMGVQDYAAWRCTGSPAVSAGSALRLGILNKDGTGIEAPILADVGIDPATIPPLVPVGSKLGSLSAGAAAELGLTAGIPLVACPGDVPAAFMAADDSAARQAFVNLGTTTVVCCRAPAGSGQGFTREVLGQGSRSIETGAGCGGITFDWLSRLLGLTLGELEALAMEHRPARLDFDPELLDPWGAGAGGSIVGIRPEVDRGGLARAAYRAVARRVLSAVAELAVAAGGIDRLAVGGGGAGSDLLCREFAAAWQGSLQRFPGRELAAEGAATIAARAVYGHQTGSSHPRGEVNEHDMSISPF